MKRRKSRVGFKGIALFTDQSEMTKKILIFGADGLLGRDISSYFSKYTNFSVHGVGRSQVNITDYSYLETKVNFVNPDFVINCAAYTNVDKAETEKEKCRTVNVEGARNIAKAVSNIGAELIQISTASVFTSYNHEHIPAHSNYSPSNYYSQTKAEAEQICQEILNSKGSLTIMRTYWLYGFSKPNFCSFVANNLNANNSINVVKDQNGQPTSTKTVFQTILHRIENRVPTGTYPATNSGHTSRIEWAKTIANLLKKPKSLIKSVDTSFFESSAQRPFNTSLDHSTWNQYGIYMDDWKMSLSKFLGESSTDE